MTNDPLVDLTFACFSRQHKIVSLVHQRYPPVYNAANLAMFMVNLSHLLLNQFRPTWPTFSVNDLKAYFRGRKYVLETLKFLPQLPEPIFIEQICAHIARIGSINTP